MDYFSTVQHFTLKRFARGHASGTNLLIVGADLDGVWDEFGSLLLRH